MSGEPGLEPKPKFSYEDWVTSLQEITNQDNGSENSGMKSVFEMSLETGHSDEWITKRLRIAKRLGILEVSRRKDESISGLVTWIPVYKITKK